MLSFSLFPGFNKDVIPEAVAVMSKHETIKHKDEKPSHSGWQSRTELSYKYTVKSTSMPRLSSKPVSQIFLLIDK